MDAYLAAGVERQQLLCNQAQADLGLPAISIEKDFWVCWTLRELFRLSDCGSHLTFKGGTSLSKAWKLIERFSEDIDIVVDRELLKADVDIEAMRRLSERQRERQVGRLRKACREWVQEILRPALSDRLARVPGASGLDVIVDPEARDGDRLLLRYPSAYPPALAGYLRREVKIELVARADDWPSEKREIAPYVAEVFPDLIPGAAFTIRVLTPERTFWEKAMLLHEETYRPVDGRTNARLSRHYYDLWCLIRQGVAGRAAQDRELFRRTAEHRELFFRWTWMDYGTLRPGALRLVPLADQIGVWRADYSVMRGEMFFGETPEFENILREVGNFEVEFNRSGGDAADLPSGPKGLSH